MPQPNTYGQYGFSAYGGAPGSAAPGMPSPSGAAGAIGMGAAGQAGAADPTAAAGQAAQGQWAGADPSTYYSNYWGGESTVSYRNRTRLTDVITGYYGQQPAGQQGGDAQGAA